MSSTVIECHPAKFIEYRRVPSSFIEFHRLLSTVIDCHRLSSNFIKQEIDQYKINRSSNVMQCHRMSSNVMQCHRMSSSEIDRNPLPGIRPTITRPEGWPGSIFHDFCKKKNRNLDLRQGQVGRSDVRLPTRFVNSRITVRK